MLTVNWGDGSSSTAVYSAPGLNVFNLTHQYPADATAGVPSQSFLIDVTVADKSGETASASRTIVLTNVAPAGITLTQGAASIAEGASLSLDGTFTDPGPLDSHTVTINWGDNSALTVLHPPQGVLEFSATHLYEDDRPSGTPADAYTITVTVTDDVLGTGSATALVTVTNVAPSLLNVQVTSPVSVGSAAQLSGTISDATPLDGFTLSVDWGDGTPAQNFNYPAGTTLFSANHAYAIGNTNFTIGLSLVDDDLGASSATTFVEVKASAQPARFVSLTPLPNGHALLLLEGTPHATYEILASSNLASWAPLGTATADAAGQFQFEDSTSPSSSRFYRAVAAP
jgi:hypothetical protein